MTSTTTAIDCDGYTVTDPSLRRSRTSTSTSGAKSPYPHRHVHGGFADYDTRFTFYFPHDGGMAGRLIMPLEGAHAGHEDFFGGALGDAIGGLGVDGRASAATW